MFRIEQRKIPHLASGRPLPNHRCGPASCSDPSSKAVNHEGGLAHPRRCFVTNLTCSRALWSPAEPDKPLRCYGRTEIRQANKKPSMILENLRNVDGFPHEGVNITIYGIHWTAMMMFGVAGGPVRNKTELQRFLSSRSACSGYTTLRRPAPVHVAPVRILGVLLRSNDHPTRLSRRCADNLEMIQPAK